MCLRSESAVIQRFDFGITAGGNAVIVGAFDSVETQADTDSEMTRIIA